MLRLVIYIVHSCGVDAVVVIGFGRSIKGRVVVVVMLSHSCRPMWVLYSQIVLYRNSHSCILSSDRRDRINSLIR